MFYKFYETVIFNNLLTLKDLSNFILYSNRILSQSTAFSKKLLTYYERKKSFL